MFIAVVMAFSLWISLLISLEKHWLPYVCRRFKKLVNATAPSTVLLNHKKPCMYLKHPLFRYFLGRTSSKSEGERSLWLVVFLLRFFFLDFFRDMAALRCRCGVIQPTKPARQAICIVFTSIVSPCIVLYWVLPCCRSLVSLIGCTFC